MVTVEEYRLDKDSMGEVKVPSSAYYGAETQRAVQNFPISGLRLPKEFVRAMALIKLSAARANMQLGLLDPKKGEADRKSTRLNSSHVAISYAVFCLKKKTKTK